MRIGISDDIAKALEARVAAQGLILEYLVQETVRNESARTLASREAATGILELQRLVKPDPEGWTVSATTLIPD